MTISYAITVCNEFVEIQKLLNTVFANKRPQDKVTVLYDQLNGDPEIENYLRTISVRHEDDFTWHAKNFNRDFSEWKNTLTDLCSGDYIVNIDADEYPHELLIQSLPQIIQDNLEVDVLLVPRINTVEGITPQHIRQWGWKMDEKGWLNYPDYQWRVYKNTPAIKWVNKVHENLDGFKTFSYIPQEEELSLYHPKTIQRQEKQNKLYDSI